MTALGAVVRAGVARRRLQTAVLVLTTLVAAAAGVLAAGLLIASNAPFDRGFARQHGAHLTVEFDRAAATAEQLAATAAAPGVTEAAGPFPILTATARAARSEFYPDGFPLSPMTLAGRAGPGGAVDQVSLVSGRWPTGPGEIVVASGGVVPTELSRLQFPDSPGAPVLTVVGIATSVSRTADAWVTPEEITALAPPGDALRYQMLYRFAHAATDDEIAADRAAIEEAAPPGALTGTQSWLAVKQVMATNTGVFVPFVVAFGVLGLVLSVLIIGIVISGAVAAATRRIGILRAIGFTPSQVTRAYVAQALVPAAAGVALGAVLGSLLAVPILRAADSGFGTTGLSVPLWATVGVPLAGLVAVAIAATIPALRAGRLRPVEAIAVGRAPKAGQGRRAQRVAGWLPVPRPISLGLASPFQRPGRSTLTGATVVFGVATVTLAVGIMLSLTAVETGRELDSAGQVVVDTGGPPQLGRGAVHAPVPGNQPTPPADPAAVAAAITAQPETAGYYRTRLEQAVVSGITGPTTLIGYQGDSAWATHPMISGHWLAGSGQAVVTGRFLTAAGAQLGDVLTVTNAGRSTTVTIVGEVFSLTDEGMDLLTDASTLTAVGLPDQPAEFHVMLRDGADVSAYLQGLNAALPAGAIAVTNRSERSDVIVVMDSLIALLTALLVVVAALGVLNTVVLDTRERIHDLGVVKALGMTPRQVLAMVLTAIAGVGLASAIVGVPLGVALHHVVMPSMARVTGETLPTSIVAVYGPAVVVLLVLGGIAIGVLGALAPAGWAAAVRPSTALRTE